MRPDVAHDRQIKTIKRYRAGRLLGFLYRPHQLFSSAGRASMGSRASFRLGARASASAQSPAHSLVPPTVPSGLQPTGPFGLTCTDGSLATVGAFCANALAEDSS